MRVEENASSNIDPAEFGVNHDLAIDPNRLAELLSEEITLQVTAALEDEQGRGEPDIPRDEALASLYTRAYEVLCQQGYADAAQRLVTENREYHGQQFMLEVTGQMIESHPPDNPTKNFVREVFGSLHTDMQRNPLQQPNLTDYTTGMPEAFKDLTTAFFVLDTLFQRGAANEMRKISSRLLHGE